MESRTADSERELREFWDGFPHDQYGNVIITELVRGEEPPDVIDPEIKAITDLFREKEKRGELVLT